jgi:CRP-like cAMP-binding protein
METTSTPPWKSLAFTAGLDPAQIERLTAISTPIRWEAGSRVFREGDPDSPLYVVEEGRVAIELALPGRGPVTILTVGPGEVFGWSSIFHKRPKTAAARATVPTKAWAIDSTRLRELCDRDPVLGYALTRRILQVVSERLKATRIQLIDVFRD